MLKSMIRPALQNMDGHMRYFCSCILILCLSLLGGCAGNSDSDEQVARMRFLHASPDSPAVDILIDSLQVFSDLRYGQSSTYFKVDEGERRVLVSATGETSPLLDVSIPLVDELDYTAVVTNYLSNIELLIVEDRNVDPDFGKFKLRILHAAPGAKQVDVYITDQNEDIAALEPNVANLPFKAVSDYLNFDEGELRIQITAHRKKIPIIDTGPLSFRARQIRTVVALDAPGGGEPYRAILLQDKNA